MRIAMVILLIMWLPSSASSQDCFRKVIEFSEGICAEFVRLEGRGEKVDLSGELSAELTGIFKSIADVGGEFGGSLSREEYTNILRKDVPAALEAGRQCRLDVAKSFYDKICGVEKSSGSDQRFAQQAIILDPDGYTNVRSGAGTEYSVFARILDGEVFRTHVQPGSWWQIRTPDGRIGYMHRSRIRLID